MAAPLLCTPVEWLVMGIAGVLIYKSGKNAGKAEAHKEEKCKSGKK